MKIYNQILQECDSTLELAIDCVNGLDWSEIETTERDRPYLHSGYKETVNGIDIYYDYGADYYYFVDSED